MSDNLEKLFAMFPQPDLPDGLLRKTHLVIAAERRRRALLKIVLLGFSSVVSLVGMFAAGAYSRSALVESGAWQFASLLFSDFSTVTAYWQDFAIHMLEAMPTLGLMAMSASVFTLMVSLKRFFKNISFLQLTTN